jgi:hypothetical protein
MTKTKKMQGSGPNEIMVVCIILLACIFVLIALKFVMLFKKPHLHERMKDYLALHRSRPASSVDSENQFAEIGEQWRGQSSKCYSCERQMQACGNDAVYSATKTKCFDCQAQSFATI